MPENIHQTLKNYLNNTITTVEKFYKWENIYYELMFSTRLRLRIFDFETISNDNIFSEVVLSLSEAMEDYSWLIIIGEPGTGKTTACKRAAWDIASFTLDVLKKENPSKEDIRIPIYIELRKILDLQQSQNIPLLHHLNNYIKEHILADKSEANALDKLLSYCKLTLLLDGLNEIGDHHLRNRVLDEIIQLRSNYKQKLHIVTTSRKHNFDIERVRRKADIAILEIVELSPSDIEEFAKCYLQTDSKVEEFMESLNRSLKAAARNALILKLLIEEFQKDGKPIESRSALLKNATERILKRPVGYLGAHTEKENLSLKKGILSELAWQSWNDNYKLSLTKEKALQLTESILHDSSQAEPALELLEKNGILSSWTNENGEMYIEFRMHSYHEYFTARKIRRIWLEEPRNNFNELVNTNEWHEIIALAAGLIDTTASKSQKKDGKSSESYIDYIKERNLIILAGMCAWNMNSARGELKKFELWLEERARSSFKFISRIGRFALFGVLFPVIIISLAIVEAQFLNSGYYVGSNLLSDYISTSSLTRILVYLSFPLLFFFLYRKLIFWVYKVQEMNELRPTLAALHYIGSDYTNSTIVDLYNSSGLFTIDDYAEGNLAKLDPTIKPQRDMYIRIQAWLPREQYDIDVLYEMIAYEAPDYHIEQVARLLAKTTLAQDLGLIHSLFIKGSVEVKKRVLIAGRTIVKFNRDLKSDWLVYFPNDVQYFISKEKSEQSRSVELLKMWNALSPPLKSIIIAGTLVLVLILLLMLKIIDDLTTAILSFIVSITAGIIVVILSKADKYNQSGHTS